MPDKEMVAACLSAAFKELITEATKLTHGVDSSWPKVSAPRAPKRAITPNLRLSWNYIKRPQHRTDGGLLYLAKIALPYGGDTWSPVPVDQWQEKLVRELTDTRKAVRVLARIDSFTRWFIARQAGVKKSVEVKKEQQKYWEDRLRSRFVLVDMGAQQGGGRVTVTNHEYREARSNRLNAIRMVKERNDCGLKQAIDAVDIALRNGGPTTI